VLTNQASALCHPREQLCFTKPALASVSNKSDQCLMPPKESNYASQNPLLLVLVTNQTSALCLPKEPLCFIKPTLASVSNKSDQCLMPPPREPLCFIKPALASSVNKSGACFYVPSCAPVWVLIWTLIFHFSTNQIAEVNTQFWKLEQECHWLISYLRLTRPITTTTTTTRRHFLIAFNVWNSLVWYVRTVLFVGDFSELQVVKQVVASPGLYRNGRSVVCFSFLSYKELCTC
jgi:hypothetical protein